MKNDNEAVILCLTTEGGYYILLNNMEKVKVKLKKKSIFREDITVTILPGNYRDCGKSPRGNRRSFFCARSILRIM